MSRAWIIGSVSILVVLIVGVVYAISRPPDRETLISHAMAEHRRIEVLHAAETGDAWAMNMLYLIGKSDTGKKDTKTALELMRQSDSPTAQYFHFRLTHRKKDRASREGVLSRIRFTTENLRMPFQTDEEYAEQSFVFRNSMDSLEAAGVGGDPDALWVLAQLE